MTVVYIKCMIFTKNGTLPVPGGPAKRIALPAIFLDLISSTTTPAAYNENKQKWQFLMWTNIMT